MSAVITIHPIGLIRSRFQDIVGMPIQTAAAPNEHGTLEVFPEFTAGLKDIEGFDYLIVLTHLHQVTQERLEVLPFLDDTPHGVFATRAPTRPNRIGLSIIKLERVEDNRLYFSGNDMLDQTPVIDIKPYVPAFDQRITDRVGWFKQRLAELPGKQSDDRMK